MPRRRKTRTHRSVPPAGPRSFVIKHGGVGRSLAQLVRDVRAVLEPNTATRLKERARNKLKDYLALAPALHVSHLLAFTQASVAPSLRLVRLPAGPTLSFRVLRYSLVNDLRRAARRPRSVGAEYLSPPLLVLAAFPPAPAAPPHLALLVKALHSLFPPLSPDLPLPAARRVVLVSYSSPAATLQFRHYLISVRPYALSRRLTRLIDPAAAATLDLGSHQDVADFLLRNHPPYDAASSAPSSAAEDDSDNALPLPTDYLGRNNKKGDRRAVRLDEIGPRMELSLVKIVEGVPGKDGSVIYHHFVKKTKSQILKQSADHAAKEKLRTQRRQEQERNVQRKKNAQPAQASHHDQGDSGHDQGDSDPPPHASDHDEGEWDDEEEISEGGSDDETDVAHESSQSEPEQPSHSKRRKV